MNIVLVTSKSLIHVLFCRCSVSLNASLRQTRDVTVLRGDMWSDLDKPNYQLYTTCLSRTSLLTAYRCANPVMLAIKCNCLQNGPPAVCLVPLTIVAHVPTSFRHADAIKFIVFYCGEKKIWVHEICKPLHSVFINILHRDFFGNWVYMLFL